MRRSVLDRCVRATLIRGNSVPEKGPIGIEEVAFSQAVRVIADLVFVKGQGMVLDLAGIRYGCREALRSLCRLGLADEPNPYALWPSNIWSVSPFSFHTGDW
jgi:hypothetical protein